jgi:hypothetical protein
MATSKAKEGVTQKERHHSRSFFESNYKYLSRQKRRRAGSCFSKNLPVKQWVFGSKSIADTPKHHLLKSVALPENGLFRPDFLELTFQFHVLLSLRFALSALYHLFALLSPRFIIPTLAILLNSAFSIELFHQNFSFKLSLSSFQH